MTHVIETLAPRHGVEEVAITDEEEYFPPPRQLRELVDTVAEGLRVSLGAPATAGRSDRAIDASEVLESLDGRVD